VVPVWAPNDFKVDEDKVLQLGASVLPNGRLGCLKCVVDHLVEFGVVESQVSGLERPITVLRADFPVVVQALAVRIDAEEAKLVILSAVEQNFLRSDDNRGVLGRVRVVAFGFLAELDCRCHRVKLELRKVAARVLQELI